MKPAWKAALVAAPITLVAFLLAPQTPRGQQVWPEPLHDVQPSDAQLPFFMVLALFEALGLGLAVAFLVFGWPYTKRAAGAGGPFAVLLHASIAWLFGNFWLHDNLHYINGLNMGGLLAIDFLFHVPIMAAGLVVAWAMVRMARDRQAIVGASSSA